MAIVKAPTTGSVSLLNLTLAPPAITAAGAQAGTAYPGAAPGSFQLLFQDNLQAQGRSGSSGQSLPAEGQSLPSGLPPVGPYEMADADSAAEEVSAQDILPAVVDMPASGMQSRLSQDGSESDSQALARVSSPAGLGPQSTLPVEGADIPPGMDYRTEGRQGSSEARPLSELSSEGREQLMRHQQNVQVSTHNVQAVPVQQATSAGESVENPPRLQGQVSAQPQVLMSEQQLALVQQAAQGNQTGQNGVQPLIQVRPAEQDVRGLQSQLPPAPVQPQMPIQGQQTALVQPAAGDGVQVVQTPLQQGQTGVQVPLPASGLQAADGVQTAQSQPYSQSQPALPGQASGQTQPAASERQQVTAASPSGEVSRQDEPAQPFREIGSAPARMSEPKVERPVQTAGGSALSQSRAEGVLVSEQAVTATGSGVRSEVLSVPVVAGEVSVSPLAAGAEANEAGTGLVGFGNSLDEAGEQVSPNSVTSTLSTERQNGDGQTSGLAVSQMAGESVGSGKVAVQHGSQLQSAAQTPLQAAGGEQQRQLAADAPARLLDAGGRVEVAVAGGGAGDAGAEGDENGRQQRQESNTQNVLQQAAQMRSQPAQSASQHLPATQLQLLTPSWGQAVGERMIMMAQHGPRSAQIQLDPPELGAMQIRIHVQGQDQVSVSFTSPNPAVREALEQQMPRLREMMAEQGLNLSEGSISDQPGSGQRDEQAGSSGGRSGGYAGQGGEAEAERSLVGGQVLGLVDYYA